MSFLCYIILSEISFPPSFSSLPFSSLLFSIPHLLPSFTFFLLFWTYNTLTSASGMLALQPCATTPSSESLFLFPSMFKDCPLSGFPIFVLLYLKKRYVCTCMYILMHMCVCLYGCSCIYIHYDWEQQWSN